MCKELILATVGLEIYPFQGVGSVVKKWYDSWWFKLRSFSLQLKCAQSTQAGYYYTLSE